MNPSDKLLFQKYLDASSRYFEWGSGGSTYLAAMKPNIKSITSIESDTQWFRAVNDAVKGKSHVKIVLVDLHCDPNNWGRPGSSCSENEQKRYSSQILYSNPDLILIDGRYRIACCLKCFSTISDDCVVLFDDFLTRPHYNVVLTYFDVIEKTTDNCMVVLKKKTGQVAPTDEFIRKYELDPQ